MAVWQPVTSPRGFRLLCTATFFHFLSMGVFLSGLPLFVSREITDSRAAVGVAVASFSVTAVLCRPFVGRQADRIGRRPFVYGSPLLIVVTSLALIPATALWTVVGLRLLQGLAGAAFYTSSAAAATDLAPEGSRAAAISRFSLFLYGGFALGPAIGEWLIENISYWAAWAAAATAGVVAFAAAFAMPETAPPVDRAAPMAPFRAIHPMAMAPGFVLLTTAVGYTSISSFTPLYARSIGMASSGGLYLTFSLTILVVRLASGGLADRVGRARVALPGLVSEAAGMFLLAAVATPWSAFVGVSLFAAGHALVFPALAALVIDRVNDEERGEAMGSFTAFFDVGAATGGYAVGYVADQAGFGLAWATPGVLCGIGAAFLTTFALRVRASAARAAAAADIEPAGT